MNSRSAHPEHFFAAVEHALALLAAGAPTTLLSTMARGATRRGLVDAASGYDHVLLRMMATEQFNPAEQFDPGETLCGHGDRCQRIHYLGGGLWVCFECLAKLLIGGRRCR